jgi:hypothetical protein
MDKFRSDDRYRAMLVSASPDCFYLSLSGGLERSEVGVVIRNIDAASGRILTPLVQRCRLHIGLQKKQGRGAISQHPSL